jgi:enoyl-CoA hydratase/carnithine racemase
MPAPLHPGMTALLQARLPLRTVHEALVTGKRYPGPDALAARIVDELADEAQLMPRALELAARQADKAHPIMAQLKRGMYEGVLEKLALRWSRERR